MFKKIGNEVWAFDAEWVPDPKAGRLLYKLPNDMSEREIIEEMWKQGGASEENPQPFLKLILCRVVSIAAVIRTAQPDGSAKLALKSLPNLKDNKPDQDESAILSLFLNTIGKLSPQLVGFNSHSADLKIMIQRAITRGITAPAFCKRPEKPWGEEADYFARYGDDHVDLKEIVSGFGKGTPSLNELATLSGTPGKMDVDGKGVAGMWLSGDIQGIVAYNEFDALTTYLVWLRTAHFAGFFSEEQYAQEQDFVRNLIKEKTQEPGYGHLKTYLDEWDRLQALT